MPALSIPDVEAAVRRWLDTFVVGMQLCPFAAAPLAAGRVRVAVTQATTEEALLEALARELQRLEQADAPETTLVVHPAMLQDFDDYNQFLDLADALLAQAGYEGIFQVASFHPHYRFAGTPPDAAENYTNRSPYPVLHLLREASIEKALATLEDPAAIPERNIRHMNTLGRMALARLLRECL